MPRRKRLKTAAMTLQEILHKPLSLHTSQDNLSLLAAAQAFTPSDGPNSHLSKILTTLAHHPEATQVLAEELRLIQDEMLK